MTSENVMERLAAQVFFGWIRQIDIACEVAKQSSRAQARVRRLDDNSEKSFINTAVLTKIIKKVLSKKNNNNAGVLESWDIYDATVNMLTNIRCKPRCRKSKGTAIRPMEKNVPSLPQGKDINGGHLQILSEN